MCRIFGHLNGNLNRSQMRIMSALQHHGGPDRQRAVAGSGWGLGINRLAIVDLDGGMQPYSLGRDIHVVFNGEIYNHRELRAHLGALGHKFHDDGDGAVLPALYQEYGDSFVERLDGMFAVAVVDLRREPRLLLATDHAGMKPIYYHWNRSRNELVFASEIPALLGLPGVEVVEDPYALDAYLSTKTPFGERTMFAGVEVLARATTLTFAHDDGVRIVRRDTRAQADIGDPAESASAIRSELDREIGRLVMSDVPICAVVSGGLDSSLVGAMLAARTQSLATFNIAYQGDWPFDERHFAREVADSIGSDHRQVLADPATFPDALHDVVWHLGQPNADPICISTYLLFRAVRDAGFKVALTGDGADEIFGGYDRMRAAVAAPTDPSGTSGWADTYVDALAAVPRDLRRSLYSSDFDAEITRRGSVADRLVTGLLEHPGDRLDAITTLETDQRLPAYHLRRVDHLSMASSVEVRLPFMQKAVVGRALALPADQRIRNGRGKVALYESARGLVPDSVLNRPKQPFTLPITAMLRRGAPLMDLAQDTLRSRRLADDPRIDADAVCALLDLQQNTPSDTAALAVWSLLVHQMWSEQFIAGSVRVSEGIG